MWRRQPKPPNAIAREVARKSKRLGHVAILDYADTHGTELAQALYRLRQHPGSVEAMAEAQRQYAVIGALLDELKLRQDATV